MYIFSITHLPQNIKLPDLLPLRFMLPNWDLIAAILGVNGRTMLGTLTTYIS